MGSFLSRNRVSAGETDKVGLTWVVEEARTGSERVQGGEEWKGDGKRKRKRMGRYQDKGCGSGELIVRWRGGLHQRLHVGSLVRMLLEGGSWTMYHFRTLE